MTNTNIVITKKWSSEYNNSTDYTVSFFGYNISTTVTADPTAVTSWITSNESTWSPINLGKLIVGLDVEWRPPFSRVPNPVATIQICIDNRCLVYQIIHTPYIPMALWNFLSNERYAFVGVGVGDDLAKLTKDYDLAVSAIYMELGKYAAAVHKRPELKNKGLKDLAMLVLEKEIEKPRWVTLSNWAQSSLTDDQVMYACVDAYVSYEIGIKLVGNYFIRTNSSPAGPNIFHIESVFTH